MMAGGMVESVTPAAGVMAAAMFMVPAKPQRLVKVFVTFADGGGGTKLMAVERVKFTTSALAAKVNSGLHVTGFPVTMKLKS